ncbi:MAG TPA: helix-turn-helix transcriptional regulator [Terrimesophilobacter sp.]|nr:helix-turn-helix transcriptional regulator [Terrimesophilobacter sp.]
MTENSAPPEWDDYVRELGLTLARHRRDLGLSQEELAYAAGITRSHYQQLEKGYSRPGRPANPSLRTLVALAQVLGLTVSELLPEKQPEPAEGRVRRRDPAA